MEKEGIIAMTIREIKRLRVIEEVMEGQLKQGKAAKLSVPTVDHYVPMIYSLGLADGTDDIQFTNEETLGSISMRAFRIG